MVTSIIFSTWSWDIQGALYDLSIPDSPGASSTPVCKLHPLAAVCPKALLPPLSLLCRVPPPRELGSLPNLTNCFSFKVQFKCHPLRATSPESAPIRSLSTQSPRKISETARKTRAGDGLRDHGRQSGKGAAFQLPAPPHLCARLLISLHQDRGSGSPSVLDRLLGGMCAAAAPLAQLRFVHFSTAAGKSPSLCS